MKKCFCEYSQTDVAALHIPPTETSNIPKSGTVFQNTHSPCFCPLLGMCCGQNILFVSHHFCPRSHAARMAPLSLCVHCSKPFASEHSAVQSFCRSRYELSRRSETMQINHFMCQKYSSLLTDTFLLLGCLYAAPTPSLPPIGTKLLKQYCFPIFVGSQFRPPFRLICLGARVHHGGTFLLWKIEK